MSPLGRILPRKVAGVVAEALTDTRVVLVNGARQGGKSTLVAQIGAARGADLLSLDRASVRQAALEDPATFVVRPEGLVVIDEVQRVPELFLAIKESADWDPQPGRFLLTGSARLLGLRGLPDALPGRSGQLLVPGAVGNQLALSRPTVARYLSLLEEVFLIRRIPAWSRNVNQRAVGTPKVALVDSGIAANLLDLGVDQLTRPTATALGGLLEGFVAMEIARQLTWSRTRADMFHYRTKDGVEVDLILEDRRGRAVAIDVKASSTVRGGDFRGLRHLAERVGDDFLVGLVLYTGEHTLPFGPRLRAMPISALWECGG